MEWVSIVAVRRGSQLELWTNGMMTAMSSIPANATLYVAPTGGTASAIGATRSTAGSSDSWYGFLDELRLYNYALSPTEIAAL